MNHLVLWQLQGKRHNNFLRIFADGDIDLLVLSNFGFWKRFFGGEKTRGTNVVVQGSFPLGRWEIPDNDCQLRWSGRIRRGSDRDHSVGEDAVPGYSC
jgi:hypothetical protein